MRIFIHHKIYEIVNVYCEQIWGEYPSLSYAMHSV